MRCIATQEANNLVKTLPELLDRTDYKAVSLLQDEVKEEMALGMLIQSGLESGLATAAETQQCNELLGLAHAV